MSQSIQHEELPAEKAFELWEKTQAKENILVLLQELNQQSDNSLAKGLRKTIAEYQKRIERIDPQFLDVSNFKIELFHSLFYKARVESSKERNYPIHLEYQNYFHYDLIELRNGTHVPVTMIKPFWRNWFEQTKPNKTRDSEFFKCPKCANRSFYSQWQNGCNWCHFRQEYEIWGQENLVLEIRRKNKHLLERRMKRQRRKNFLMKTGLWVFFVKSYVSCPFTKGKWLTKKEIQEWVAGEE